VTFVVLGLLVIAGMTVSAVTLSHLNDAQHRQVDRLDPALQANTDLFVSLVNQQTGLRGYALTRDPQYLRPYEQGRIDTDRDLERLRARIVSEPTLKPLVEEFATRARAWQDAYVEPAVRLVQQTPQDETPDLDFARGKAYFDQVRASYDRLNARFADARLQARNELTTSTAYLFALVIGAAVLAVVASLLLWIALRRWVTRPLMELGREVRIVAGGDLEHQVQPGGPPDVAAVAADAELMRRRLRSEYQAAVGLRHEALVARDQIEAQALELRRSNAELEQFAYIASHDLQEPLRKVASFCQMLERRYAGQLDERADRYIAFAVDGAKRMQNLINDLLAFSRVGRTTAGFQPVDLNLCVATAIADLETLIEETGARIDVGELMVVPGDASLLRQLFLNLIGNAVKFRGEAPPHVWITGEPAVDGDGHGDVGLFAVTVADNGIGIDPRYAEKVFAIFSRLHAREEYEGTGIGLALCRKIVEFHGGTINVVLPGAVSGDADDPAGSGATLRFTLPTEVRSAPSHATSPPEDA
jgi:signal transduction histidine kinase